MTYNSLFGNSDLIIGEGNTAVITGWSKASIVASKLDPKLYAVAGNFYSATTGMNYLIRNLLYNPHIRHIIGFTGTQQDANSGSMQCLEDFFNNGVKKGLSATGAETWVVDSDHLGYIDTSIPIEIIERIRQNIFYVPTNAITEIEVFLTKFSECPRYGKEWSKSVSYPMVETTTKILPANPRNHAITAETIADAWTDIIYRIRTFGKLKLTHRGDKWQELIDLVVTINNEPEDFNFPDYLPFDRQFLGEYIDQILCSGEDSQLVKYTYGSRLRSWFGVDQIQALIEKIIDKPNASSLVLSLWDAEKDLTMGDSPCLNHLKFYIDDENKLNLTATIRSNEMYSAWLANAMQLKALQRYVADQVNRLSTIGLQEGMLTTISQSAHIYEHSWQKADELIKTHYLSANKPQEYTDPIGSFVLIVDRKAQMIVVEHIHPNGELLQSFTGKKALELSREILKILPFVQSDHAYYLGMELQKAEIALESGLLYRQDNPLKIVF